MNSDIIRGFAKLGSEWEGYSAVPHTFVTEGDTVVALGDYGGTCKATGKVLRFQQYTDTALVQAAMR